jgi:Protein of unknown function (DUF642)
MTSRYVSLLGLIVLVAVAACSSNVVSPPAPGSGVGAQAAIHHGLFPVGSICPAGNNPPTWPDARNKITDGAFNPAPLPNSFDEYSGAIPGITWAQSVPGGTVDLVGLNEWGAPSPGNECTMDLDGDNHGGISESFATTPNKVYCVSFQMSGSIDPPRHVNKMLVSAAGQSRMIRWDTTSPPNHDVYHGVYERKLWRFTATDTTTTLEFKSLDPPGDTNSGTIVTEIVVK